VELRLGGDHESGLEVVEDQKMLPLGCGQGGRILHRRTRLRDSWSGRFFRTPTRPEKSVDIPLLAHLISQISRRTNDAAGGIEILMNASTGPVGDRLDQAAQVHLVGGMSASARANPAIGHPFYAAHGEGARVVDVDGKEYIDLNMSYGAALLGHGHPVIKEAVERALELGILCGYETSAQSEVANQLAELVPCIDLVRFAGSGTETTWHAIRTARAFTGRSKVVKFESHFHGYNDVVGFSMFPPLDQAGPSLAPAAFPESAGMPPHAIDDVVVLPWNDLDALSRTLRASSDIAAVIMEPINYDSGGLLPLPGYLEGVRELTDELGPC
jgi:glutamate-1-semialdehyde aminotransferase